VKEAFRQLWRECRSQKLRTFLTVSGSSGTGRGVAAFSRRIGLKHQQIRRVEGPRRRIVSRGRTHSIPFNGLGKGRKIRVSEEDIGPSRARPLGSPASRRNTGKR